MKLSEAQAAIELLQTAGAKNDERLYSGLEKHLAASDRVIGQVAQLKLLSEDGTQLDEALGALATLAAQGNPT